MLALTAVLAASKMQKMLLERSLGTLRTPHHNSIHNFQYLLKKAFFTFISLVLLCFAY